MVNGARRFARLFLAGVAAWLCAGGVFADPAPLQPTGMTITIPAGGNNGTRNGLSAPNAFVDDALLNTITFSGYTYSLAGGSFRYVTRARVTSADRTVVNAEFGDLDNGADGNPNPFVSAGLVPEGQPIPLATQESTNPAIQDPAIRASFNSLSLVQGIDGENANYSIDFIFQNGIVDNNNAVDNFPEMIFFERGKNSSFSVQAITGGTFLSPTFASTTANVSAAQQWQTPYYIDTVEIGGGQVLGCAGLDLNEFGLSSGETVYGFRLNSTGGTGADMYGLFFSAVDPGTQIKPLANQLGMDYGDLPSPYKTREADGGPSYDFGTNEWLGASWDGEADGQPQHSALGDDWMALDDEDGVVYINGQYQVTMSVSNYNDTGRYDPNDPTKEVYLRGFIDLNNDGDFDDPGENVLYYSGSPTTWAQNTKLVTVTPSFGYGLPGQIPIYSRWRFTYGLDIAIPTGHATYGEVEDYVTLPEPATVVLLIGGLGLLARRRRVASAK
jgi:hypothetical protein